MRIEYKGAGGVPIAVPCHMSLKETVFLSMIIFSVVRKKSFGKSVGMRFSLC